MTKIHDSVDKTRLYLGLDKTTMMWLGFKKQEGNPENLRLTLKQNALRNQLDKYEYGIADILEKDVKENVLVGGT
jgi:hypothetical protein